MKWLYRLDYKYGKYHIRHLMNFIVGGMALVFILNTLIPTGVTQYLILDRTAILQGLQLWRLVTFLFVPTTSSYLWVFFSLYFYWMIGGALENIWGGFRFNLYYLIGWLGAIISMFITGYASNTYLNLSLFLAFATVSPDSTFNLFMILPIKAKWMAIAYAVITILSTLQAFTWYGPAAGIPALVTLVFSLLNYLLFFGRSAFETLGNQIRMYRQRRQWHNNNRR